MWEIAGSRARISLFPTAPESSNGQVLAGKRNNAADSARLWPVFLTDAGTGYRGCLLKVSPQRGCLRKSWVCFQRPLSFFLDAFNAEKNGCLKQPLPVSLWTLFLAPDFHGVLPEEIAQLVKWVNHLSQERTSLVFSWDLPSGLSEIAFRGIKCSGVRRLPGNPLPSRPIHHCLPRFKTCPVTLLRSLFSEPLFCGHRNSERAGSL